jgi:hypothetical protein
MRSRLDLCCAWPSSVGVGEATMVAIRRSEDASVLRIVSYPQRLMQVFVGTLLVLLLDVFLVIACLIVLALAAAVMDSFGATSHSASLILRSFAFVLLSVCVVPVVWNVWRGARLSTEFRPEGIVVRNPYRTYRIDWEQVSWFGNGRWTEGEGGFVWVLAIGTDAPWGAICCRSTSAGRRDSDPSIVDAIRQVAVVHSIPDRFADEHSVLASGLLNRLHDKFR